MKIEVVKVAIKTHKTRLATVLLKYYDLLMMCDLCIFKEERLWIRMPEIWRNEQKQRFCAWEKTETSEAFQREVLKQIEEKEGITLQKGIELRNAYMERRKSVTTSN